MVARDHIDALLADLSTILDIASAGIISKSETRLEAGEVRPAAILFIDVVGFSTISRRLSPEQLSRLIDSSFRIFELTAKSFGGYLDKVIGDAGLYVFAGHPNYAPPCEAALSAALKIQERAAKISQSLAELELSLPVRCGVSFGEVAKQAVGGEDVQITVMGDTVNLAQRLEASAVPGTVLTHQAVIKKAGAIFDHESLGKRELKGVGEHKVYEVRAKQTRAATLRGSYGKLSPFIGREKQLAESLKQIASWAELDYGPVVGGSIKSSAREKTHNRLLVISGEQAIGKSRFALELTRQLPTMLESGPPVLHTTAHCSEYATLLTFTAELARIAGLTADNLETCWDELSKLAAETEGPDYAERLRRHLPLLAYVLGATGIDTSGIKQGGAQAFSTGCRLAVRACCELAALEGSQVVLVIEDVQWLGNLRELLSDLLSHTRLPHPLVVIATARPEFKTTDANLCQLLGIEEQEQTEQGKGSTPDDSGSTDPSSEHYRVIELPLLDAGQGEALIQQLLPGVQLPEEMQVELHAKASGLPYYYEEFARMLADSGMVRERRSGKGRPGMPAVRDGGEASEPGVFRLERRSEGMAMPDDIRMLLLGRLDMLTPRSKDLAMRASVLGRNVSLGLLNRVEKQLGLDSDEWLSEGLAELEQAGILVDTSGGSYMFEHLLTRDAAYDSLLNQNRSVVHGAVADVLSEDLTPGSVEEWEILPQLIDHLDRGGRLKEGHDRCCELMIIQAQSGRTDEWDKWEVRARSMRNRLAAEPEREQADEGLYLRAVGVRQLMHSELTAAKENFSQALSLAVQANDYAAMVSNLSNLAMIAHREKEYDQAISVLKTAIGISQQHDLEEQCGRLYANLSKYYIGAGNHEQAVHCCEVAEGYFTKSANIRGMASVQINLGIIQEEAGHDGKAGKCYTRALELSQQLGDRLLECVARTNLGSLRQQSRQFDKARSDFYQALDVSREINSLADEQIILFNLGEVSFDEGCFEEAQEHYSQSLRLTSLGAGRVDPVYLHCALARTLAALEQFDASLEQLEFGTDEAKRAPSALMRGVVDSCLAYYYLQIREMDEADKLLASVKASVADSAYSAGSQVALEISRAEARRKSTVKVKST